MAVREAAGVTVGRGVRVANGVGSRFTSVGINVGVVASVTTVAGKTAMLLAVQAASPITRPRTGTAIRTTFIVLLIEF